MTNPHIKKELSTALIASAITFIIVGATAGLILDGYNIQTAPEKPIYAAIIVFFARLLIAFVKPLLSKKPKAPQSISQQLPRPTWQKIAFTLSLLLGLTALPFFADNYWLGILVLTLIYVLLGLGLNIVVGLAGLLDLGFVAFYAVGAYGYALSYEYLGLGFWGALLFASSLAGICGAILGFPVLRLHGDYLAIVTLGFGEIIHLVLTNWIDFTGGPNGVRAEPPTLFGLEFMRRARQGGTPFHEYFGIEYNPEARYIFIYLSLLLVVCLVTFAVVRLKNMPIGRAWQALRENEIACKALGINHVTVKLSAFSMGAFIGGLAGVFFAGFQRFIDPLSFTFIESALILAIVVLGGMGSTFGVILAAVVITLTPEFLREFSDYRILIFGLLMVFMMIWKPQGLIKERRKHFKLEAQHD